MTPNNGSSFGHSGQYPRKFPRPKPKPHVEEQTVRSETISVERKKFHFALKENARGRFLRITEEVGDRFQTVIVPAPGLEEFGRVLADLMKTYDELPPLASEISEIQKDIQ